MVERQLGELQLGRLAQEPVLPAGAVQVAQPHHRRADLRRDALHGLAAVEVLAVVAVAVHGQQHLGLDLGEAVDHRLGAEVRRAGRPHRPDRRAGQERGDGLGDVGQVRRHPVARLDAHGLQAGGDPGHLLAQLAAGERVQLAQLGGVVQRHGGVVVALEHVLRVGQARAREPLGARACRARPGPARRGCRPGPRSSPRSRPRTPRGCPPTTATAIRSRRSVHRARRPASAGRRSGWWRRCGLRMAPTAAAPGRSRSRRGPYRLRRCALRPVRPRSAGSVAQLAVGIGALGLGRQPRPLAARLERVARLAQLLGDGARRVGRLAPRAPRPRSGRRACERPRCGAAGKGLVALGHHH